jgi:hypothetical protein
MQKIPAREVSTERETFGKADLESSLKEIKSRKFMDFVNVKDFGAVGDGVENDISAINNCLQKNKKIYIPEGIFLISSSIIIPSDRTLLIDKNATIKLSGGANDYIIVNEDQQNGNENITIKGLGGKPTIDGNKRGGQIRNYTGTALETYYGMGLWLVNIKNLKIENLLIKDTEAWGIGYWDIDGLNCNNITFDQSTDIGSNGDGITGSGSNILIENIDGYTNDDMIAVGTGDGSMQGNDMGMSYNDIINITIKNIFPKKKNNQNTHRAVRLNVRNEDDGTTHYMSNVLIDNVRGYVYENLIDLGNHWQSNDEGKFFNINISNIEQYYDDIDNHRVTPLQQTITVSNCRIQDFYINNFKKTEKDIIDGIGFLENTQTENIFISNSLFWDNCDDSALIFFKDGGNTRNINFSNVKYIRAASTTSSGNGYIYNKVNNTTYRTNVFLSNTGTRKVDTTTQSIVRNGGVGNFRVNGISDFIDTSMLTPQIGDTVIDTNGNLVTYDGNAWS